MVWEKFQKKWKQMASFFIPDSPKGNDEVGSKNLDNLEQPLRGIGPIKETFIKSIGDHSERGD